MAYKKETIICTDNKELFLREFINKLTAVSDKVTLDQVVTDEGEVNAYVKVFGRYIICFTYKNSAGSYIYYTVKNGDNTLVNTQQITVTPGSSYVPKITYRLAANDKAVCLRLSNYNTSQKDVINFDMIFIISESNIDRCAFKASDSTTLSVSVNAMTSYFLKADDGTQACKAYNRLVYTADTSGAEFEIITSKNLISDTIKTDATSGLFDCSNITPDTLYMLDGKQYYAVDSNTLMEV